jgi:hypothetical protein
MGFLFCEKCNGYYELQKGESPDDFDRCQCGRKLKYVENHSFGNTNNEKENFEVDKSYVVKVCEDCNEHYKIPKNDSSYNFMDYCQCGGKLKYAESIDNQSNKNEKLDDIIDSIITAFMFLIAVGTSGVCLFYINLTSQASISFICIGIPCIALMGFVWLMFLKFLYSLVKE